MQFLSARLFLKKFCTSGIRREIKVLISLPLRGLKLGNLKIVHRPDKIIFRFERSMKHSNGRTNDETSLLVFYLEENEFDGKGMEIIKKIGYFPGGKFVPGAKSF